jgi:hypothetical protein
MSDVRIGKGAALAVRCTDGDSAPFDVDDDADVEVDIGAEAGVDDAPCSEAGRGTAAAAAAVPFAGDNRLDGNRNERLSDDILSDSLSLLPPPPGLPELELVILALDGLPSALIMMRVRPLRLWP